MELAKREANIKRFENLMNTVERDGKDDLMDYIRYKTDFHVAPASTQYHLACEGGLLQHSLNVYDCLIAKKESSIWSKVLTEVSSESILHEADLEASKLMEDVDGNKIT